MPALESRVIVFFRLPIICHMCGDTSWTTMQRIEAESLGHAKLMMERASIGTTFPVGWTRYHNLPRDIYRCPKCAPSTTFGSCDGCTRKDTVLYRHGNYWLCAFCARDKPC